MKKITDRQLAVQIALDVARFSDKSVEIVFSLIKSIRGQERRKAKSQPCLYCGHTPKYDCEY